MPGQFTLSLVTRNGELVLKIVNINDFCVVIFELEVYFCLNDVQLSYVVLCSINTSSKLIF